MKVCNKCGVELILGKNFSERNAKGHHNICNDCQKIYSRENARIWRRNNKKHYRIYCKNYRKNNLKKIHSQESLFRKRQRQTLKNEIIILLGGKCSNPNCPISFERMDIRCLQIDHINGGGIKERKLFNGNGTQYYRCVLGKIKVGSKDYQLLCAYCNWIKRYGDNI